MPFLNLLEEKLLSKVNPVEAGDDPVQFSIDVLGVTPWEIPAQVMRSVRDNVYTTVRAGHKVSKSHLAASTAIWWALGPQDSRVLLTSYKDSSVRDIIWRELRNLKDRALVPLPGTLNKMPANGWDLGNGRQIVGRVSDKPEGVAGISSPRLLIIVDEANGLEDNIFEALEGNMAGGAHMLLLGNPTRVTGRFYDSFHGQKEIWSRFHIPSTESPNVKAGKIVIPGLATQEWVDARKKVFTPAQFAVRVMGEFAESDIETLIKREWIDAAFDRHDQWVRDGKPGVFMSIGGDPASSGGPDSCTMVTRYDVGIEAIHRYPNKGPLDLADVIEQEYRSRGSNSTAIVDVLSGPGTADSLKRKKVPCIAYKGSEKTDRRDATGYLEFVRVRAAAYWKLRDGLNPERGINMILPRNEALVKQLVCIDFWENVNGKICITTKDDVKALLSGESPDEADGVVMAWWVLPRPKHISIRDAL